MSEELFTAKELAVLAQLWTNARKASTALSKSEKSLLPKADDWRLAVETNTTSEWEALARRLRSAAYTFQCDPDIVHSAQTALSHLATPIHGRLMRDNTIPVFDEAPDDLVFPEDAANSYRADLAALDAHLAELQSERAALKAENAALLEQIKELRARLAEEQTRVDALISQSRGWQISILTGNELKLGDINLGGEWWEAGVTLIGDKAIRDLLIGGLRKAARSGRALFAGVTKWAHRHSIAAIERGARQRVDSLYQLEQQLELEKVDDAPEAVSAPEPPEDFDYVEVYNYLLRGKPVPDRWAPFITELNFNFSASHYLDRKQLSRIAGEPLKFADSGVLRNLQNLQTLHLANTQVADIQPLKDLTSLQTLDLRGTTVTDIQPLKDMKSLQTLNLRSTTVADIQPLMDLTSLQTLDLRGTPVADIQPLKNLTSLQGLGLTNTQVADIQPLKDLTTLQAVLLGNTLVEDIKPLKDLTSLQTLDLSGMPVADIKPIMDLTSLRTLDLSGMPVADIKPLKDLTSLRTLDLNGTQVADIQPLKDLTSLQTLDLSGTPVADIQPLKDITSLLSLNLRGTTVADIKPLNSLKRLRELNLTGTNIKDTAPLSNLVAAGLEIHWP